MVRGKQGKGGVHVVKTNQVYGPVNTLEKGTPPYLVILTQGIDRDRDKVPSSSVH